MAVSCCCLLAKALEQTKTVRPTHTVDSQEKKNEAVGFLQNIRNKMCKSKDISFNLI